MANTPEDRISSLPDGILTHILSFLPTNEAAATSILSSRWNFVWMAVPVLDIDCFTPHNFVDRVLVLNDTPSLRLVRFGIHDDQIEHFDLWSWIRNILRREVFELVVDCPTFEVDERWPPAQGRISNDKLKVLKLCGNHNDEYPLWFPLTKLFLPNLLILHLDNFDFKDYLLLNSFLSDLPCLTELVIQRYQGLRSLYICSSSLKKLKISTTECNYPMQMLRQTIVEAPCLEYLYIDDDLSECKFNINVPSLAEGEFKFYRGEWNNMVQFLKQVLSLKTLHIMITNSIVKLQTTTFLKQRLELPEFLELTHLNVSGHCLWERSLHLRLLLILCEKTPNLVSLKYWDSRSDEDEEFKLPKSLPKCFSSSLKEVDIYNPRNGVTEFLFRHAVVLKVMRIHINRGWTRDIEAIFKLLKLPMASSNCKLIIHTRS